MAGLSRSQHKVRRRQRGLALLRQGRSVREVARQLKVTPRAVQWWRKHPQPREYSGRPSRLTDDQRRQARLALLARFDMDSQGVRRAARIIAETTGVVYAEVHVRRLLRQLKVTEVPRGVQFGAYNTTKHRCPNGHLVVKRFCYQCYLEDLKK